MDDDRRSNRRRSGRGRERAVARAGPSSSSHSGRRASFCRRGTSRTSRGPSPSSHSGRRASVDSSGMSRPSLHIPRDIAPVPRLQVGHHLSQWDIPPTMEGVPRVDLGQHGHPVGEVGRHGRAAVQSLQHACECLRYICALLSS